MNVGIGPVCLLMSFRDASRQKKMSPSDSEQAVSPSAFSLLC